MANANSTAVQAITSAAQKYGIDPAAMIAVSRVESGLNPKAVGDSGHAFGLFQFNNAGGIITGDPNPGKYLDANYNALQAARHIASIKGIQGARGAAAVKLIVNQFERPANKQGEISKALSYLGNGNAGSVPTPTISPSVNGNISQPSSALTNGNGSPASFNPVQALLQNAMAGSAPSTSANNGSLLSVLTQDPNQVTAPTISTTGLSMAINPTSPQAPQVTTQAAGPTAGKVVALAQKYMGTPYKWGGADPKTGFDCSGFVQYLYKQQGVNLPRTTQQQVNVGKAVDKNNLRPGDLVFFNTEGRNSHEGLYIGDGQFIQAPHTGDHVKISSLSDPYYAKRFSTARRVA